MRPTKKQKAKQKYAIYKSKLNKKLKEYSDLVFGGERETSREKFVKTSALVGFRWSNISNYNTHGR